jgi:hypothetical protein
MVESMLLTKLQRGLFLPLFFLGSYFARLVFLIHVSLFRLIYLFGAQDRTQDIYPALRHI